MREYAAELAAEGGTVLFAKAPVFPVSSTEVRALAAKAGRWTALCPKAWRRTLRGTIFIRPRPGRPDAPGCRTFEAHASAGPLRARIEAT